MRGTMVLGVLVTVVAGGTAVGADSTAGFAPPRRIEAGEALVGEGRLYPSPVLHDVDGDGLADLVVGDLVGKVTYAPRIATEDGSVRFGAETPFLDRRAEQLKFHNW